jgi:prevent-host-death family protein
MLLKAQREPVQINKNGKPVAVVISMDEYQQMEAVKFTLLQERAARAKLDIENGNLVEGEQFMASLISGKLD